MLVFDCLVWWYTSGLGRLFHTVERLIRQIVLTLSVSILLRTLFAPWRRIISYGGRSIGDRLRAVLDNVISRIVGTIVRFLVLLVAFIGVMVTATLGCVALVVWPLAPLIALALLVRGLA